MGILFSRTAADANQANQAAVVETQANQAGEQTPASVPAGAGAAATTMQPAVAPSAQSTTSESWLTTFFTSVINVGRYVFTTFLRNTWKAIQAFLNIPIQSIGFPGFQICDTCREVEVSTTEVSSGTSEVPPADTPQAADTTQAVANA